MEILQFVIAGKTNKTIAAEMYISEKTVEFHLDNIYTKIGVRTRLMAGIWALHRGLPAKTGIFPSPKAYITHLKCLGTILIIIAAMWTVP